MDLLKSGITAILISLFCIWLLRPLAIQVGFVDKPNARKWHEKEVPLVGGISLFFSFCFVLLTLPFSLLPYRGLVAGSSILVLIGVIDDYSDLSSKLRLFAQLFAALLMITWGNIVLSDLGDLFFIGDLKIAFWSVPLTVLAVITNINAMNMIDGQDGLAGGVGLGQAILLLFLSAKLGAESNVQLLFVLIILLIVFLSFNIRLPWRRYAAIFMGDSGSTFIAFLLAWFAIDLSQKNTELVKPITVLWIMSLPLFDLINVTVWRFRRKKPILVASHDHFHHVLHFVGMNTMVSTFLLSIFSFSLGILGLILNYFIICDGWQFIFWLATLGLYIYIVELTRKSKIMEERIDDMFEVTTTHQS